MGRLLLVRQAGLLRCPSLPPNRTLPNGRLFLAAFAAVLGNFSFGFAMVYPSPVLPALQKASLPALQLSGGTASWFGVRPAAARQEQAASFPAKPDRPLRAVVRLS